MPKARKSLFDEPYIRIVDRLIARRLQLGLTQAGVGAAFGEDQSFISRIERRQRRIDVWEFVRLCRILDVQPSIMLDGLPE